MPLYCSKWQYQCITRQMGTERIIASGKKRSIAVLLPPFTRCKDSDSVRHASSPKTIIIELQ